MKAFTEKIALLESAKGDPGAMALIALEFLFDADDVDRGRNLMSALEAACVPHWFDQSILAAVHDHSKDASEIDLLRSFPMVEPFAARGPGSLNVHESTRIAMRRRLFKDKKEKFIALSKRAFDAIGESQEPHCVVERLYHRFIFDPDGAALECESIFRGWSNIERPELEQSLNLMLKELESSRMLHGLAQVVGLLISGWVLYNRGEVAGNLTLAQRALRLAREVHHGPTLAWALCLHGDIHAARGSYRRAEADFNEAISCIQAVLLEIPGDVGVIRDLGVAYIKLAILTATEMQEQSALKLLAKAHALFKDRLKDQLPLKVWTYHIASIIESEAEVLVRSGFVKEGIIKIKETISLRESLLAADPLNVRKKHDVATGYDRLGATLCLMESKLEEGIFWYRRAIEKMNETLSTEPSNQLYRRNLAVSYSKLGAGLIRQYHFDDGLEAQQKGLHAIEALCAVDPDNLVLRNDEVIALIRMAEGLMAVGRLIEARKTAEIAVKGSELILSGDPANLTSRRSLAVNLGLLGSIKRKSGNFGDALSIMTKALEIFRFIVIESKGRPESVHELTIALYNAALLEEERQHRHRARKFARECQELLKSILVGQPDSRIWLDALGRCEVLLRRVGG